ncbi:hypothetical protein JTE90_019399 [Oedothorax gibbosus]|uniref:Transmembrane protein n=1 Tax=Oedothorax gibbosus TaxID=931172 RepID=A0AAV6TI47_9ARAC|nr:hypothetical protein JTE90_019399 [Oedothorax gibbosus]
MTSPSVYPPSFAFRYTNPLVLFPRESSFSCSAIFCFCLRGAFVLVIALSAACLVLFMGFPAPALLLLPCFFLLSSPGCFCFLLLVVYHSSSASLSLPFPLAFLLRFYLLPVFCSLVWIFCVFFDVLGLPWITSLPV